MKISYNHQNQQPDLQVGLLVLRLCRINTQFSQLLCNRSSGQNTICCPRRFFYKKYSKKFNINQKFLRFPLPPNPLERLRLSSSRESFSSAVPDKGSEFSSFITAFAVNVVEQEPPKPLLLAGGVVGGELLKKM